MVLRNIVEKSHAKNGENLSIKFQLMETFLTYVPQNLWDAKIPAGSKGLRQAKKIGLIAKLEFSKLEHP